MAPRAAGLCVGFFLASAWWTSSARAGDSGYVVRDTTYHLVSNYGADSLLVREMQFEDRVLAAEVDSASGTLMLAFPARNTDWRFVRSPKSSRIVAYDLNGRGIRWTDVREGLPFATLAGRCLFLDGKTTEVLRLEDGKKIAGIQGQTNAWSDGLFLEVTDEEVIDWDLEEARPRWTRERETGGSGEILRQGRSAYLFGDGVQQLDLRDGSGWSFGLKASRDDLYGTLGGGSERVRSLYGGSRAVDMNAAPLVLGADVFFAADTTVVRLDSSTGAVRWRTALRRRGGPSLRERALGIPRGGELLGNLIVRDAFSKIAVASLGWASGPKNTWFRADHPTLALLSKEDGRLLAHGEVPGLDLLLDARSTEHGHYLIAYDRVVFLNDDLEVRATFRAPQELQPLGGFLDLSGSIVIVTGAGIAALTPDSLQLSWSQRCGRMLAIERDLDASGARYFVTTQGVLRLEHGSGHESADYYPLRSTSARFRYNGVVMTMGSRLWLVALPEESGLRRID